MRVTYYVAASLDGFIASADGGVGWLEDVNIPIEECGYEDFFAGFDGLMMGRKTYDQVCGFGNWPYGNKPAWVCSRQNIKPDKNLQGILPPSEVITQAKKLDIENLWLVGGAKLAASMLQENLLTHISVSTMPILLGSGIPLFTGLEQNVRLTLESSKQFEAGFVQHDYRLACD